MKRVGTFWDYENCRPPSSISPSLAAQKIQTAVETFGKVSVFKAYTDFKKEPSESLQKLQNSDVELVDTPHKGMKDVADKIMLADLMQFSLSVKPLATIVLITGDHYFTDAVSGLRQRGHEIILIYPPHAAYTCLKCHANVILDWNYVLEHPDPASKMRSLRRQCHSLANFSSASSGISSRMHKESPKITGDSSKLSENVVAGQKMVLEKFLNNKVHPAAVCARRNHLGRTGATKVSRPRIPTPTKPAKSSQGAAIKTLCEVSFQFIKPRSCSRKDVKGSFPLHPFPPQLGTKKPETDLTRP
ncbi:NYN domain-containing protein [Phellopilus nigrolimitatus]|nr:NYN domain-containing protein [Phellopilus nigrolimitatus]